MNPKVKNKPSLKHRLHEIIYEADTRGGKLFDVILLIAILASILFVMLESVQSIDEKYGSFLDVAEWVITILFSLEYALRIVTVKKPWKYIFSFYGIIDLFSTIPKYISLHSDEINTYEMCHLDGGHTEDIFSKDYENTKILLNENGIVIFDDFDMEPIYNYINRKIHDKEIYIEDDQNIIKNDKHCIYRYTNEQSSGLEYFHVFLAFLSCFIIIFFAFRFYRSRKQSSLIL